MAIIKSIRGTKDIFSPDISMWHFVEYQIRELMKCYCYNEIRTPVFEETALFARGIGDATDIVSKEMYSFLDRSQMSLTLKPEMTAAVVRSYIQNNFSQNQLINKFYYVSPMFRQERPQAGRLRQFHQVGAEIFGTKNPGAEGELIILSLKLLNRAGVDNLKLNINSVGCPVCRKDYLDKLRIYFSDFKEKLSKESQERLNKNPMRILDSKDENDIDINKQAPSILDNLCDECHLHFTEFKRFLDINSVEYFVNKNLVRGLDYYTKTAFEITSSNLGAQDAICGGGRYDILVEQLGGQPTPAVGWACGIERILLASKIKTEDINSKPDCFICILGEDIKPKAFSIITNLRDNNISCDADLHGRSLKAQMREANKQNSRFAIIIGENELVANKVEVKDLLKSEQSSVSIDELSEFIKTSLNK